MPEKTILPEEPPVETPPYQRFVALTVQFPIEKGKRIYHRVVITGAHKDLAQDLGALLPSKARTILERSKSEELKARPSSRKVETTTPKRESYYAICSCGVRNCEHLTDAIKHFFLIQDFAENSGQIIREMQDNRNRLQEASERIDKTSKDLESLSIERARLERERSELSKQLQKAQEADEKLSSILTELNDKNNEIAELRQREASIRAEREAWLAEKQELVGAYQNLRENLDTLSREIGKNAARKQYQSAEKLSDEVASVVSRHFALEPSNLEPESKLAQSVFSDHHKASNVEKVARKLSALDFVKYVGVSYRRNIKHNKVRFGLVEHELELIVADGDNGNIFKIATTAKTKAQQFFAAHLIAERFNARVELK